MDDDIVMVDPVDAALDRDSSPAPPVPPTHRSTHTDSTHEQIKGGARIRAKRSVSPEKKIKKAPELQPVYPDLAPNYDPESRTCKLSENNTQDWQAKCVKESQTKEMYEELYMARSEEVEDLRRQIFAATDLQMELDTERQLRAQVEHSLQQRSIEVEETRKKWKQVSKELNKARSQSQGFYQVTDQYLIDLTNQLRYNIRSFAIQFFEGEIRKKPRWHRTDYWDHILLATVDSTIHESFLLSSERCPSLIQSFIWKFILRKIFYYFRWSDESQGESFWKLCRVLRPKWQTDPAYEEVDPEAERRFQVWNATTTGLLLNSMTSKEPEVKKDLQGLNESFVSKICETIEPFIRTRGDHVQQLHRIINDAVALDKEINRQVARVEWVFPISGNDKVVFDPETMALEKGEKPSKEQKVFLAIAPGMKKRGKSTGDDFKDESLLIPMEVTCEPVRGFTRSKTS